jgi:glycosyltransferase involved in cell wall biosynthesis
VGARRVEIVPTVVDLERYEQRVKQSRPPLVIGWIGTPKTSRYLHERRAVWERLVAGRELRLVAVGPPPTALNDTPWEAAPWSEETEAAAVRGFDIGIMPLTDSPWEWGKCGYKLIQYMASGVPVVASPVGVNKEIVDVGVNGYLAESDDEWVECLSVLLENDDLRGRMGAAARCKVADWYSLQQQAPRLLSMLSQAANRG